MFSSSNSEFEGGYDIFLCFRGLDTRKKFTDHLYKALKIEGYRTFRDDNEIERGENIKSELRKAIRNSRISVVVLSKNYADSAACLFELQTILEHRKTSNHIILPVFYDVDPSEIREQAEKLDFGKKKVTVEEVKGWSAALKEVANTAGMVSQNQSNGYESKLIEDIVEFIREKVGYNLLHNLSKSGKQFLKPGFLAYQKQTDYARKRNKRDKANDRRLKVMGFKHNTTSFRVSVHSNGNGKRIRADVGDGDFSPSDGEDDSDDDSVGSFEEEAIEIPEKQPRISDLQESPSRYEREANTIADKVTRSTPNPDVVTQPPPTLDAKPQIEAAPVVKRGRGVARGFEVQRRLKTEGKIKGVIFDEDKWLPVGPAEKIFKMEIGILTRLLAPLHVFYWKRVTAAQKAPLFERLESEFDVKFEDLHTKNVVDKIMAMRFRQFKHRCHLHYKKFSPEEAPQHPPVNVEPLDWIPLCKHFKTDDFKKQSKAGIENRGELEVNHTSGSKSFIQRLYEMENSETGEDLETQKEPSQVNLYKETHLKKDGTWVHPRAAENYEKMEMLKNQPVQEGGNKKTEDEIREDVLKTKNGYARGLGYGLKPSKSTSRGASTRLLAQRLEEADRRVEEAERRAQECQEELQAQRSTITKLEESQLELQQAFKTFIARFGGRST